jgi:hypothetical protein
MRDIYVMVFFLACAMIAPVIPDKSGTNMLVAHLFIAGVAIMIFVGVTRMRRE